jgi:hypothetical protein
MNLRNPVQAENFTKEQMCKEPERLAHVLMIAKEVRKTAAVIATKHPHLKIDPDFSYCAALLHDIGYAPCAKNTGFHPSAGHDFLKAKGFEDLAEVIIGHSSSPEEAEEKELKAIKPSEDLVAKLITYWDMQVKQGGIIVSYEERLAEIIARYGEHSAIGRANLRAKPRIMLIFKEIENLIQS